MRVKGENEMNKLYILIIFAIINFVSQGSLLRLDMAVYPPYASVSDNQFSGFGYDRVINILEKAGIDYVIYPVPNFGRAFKNISDDVSDGFFLASQNRERDKYAVFSDPVSVSEWTWVARVDSEIEIKKGEYFDDDVKIGVQLNSNLEIWLKSKGYKVYANPSNVESLIMFLDKKRVDVIFLPKTIFYNILKKEGKYEEDYKTVVERTRNLGIYISDKYLEDNPKTIININKAIKELNFDKFD